MTINNFSLRYSILMRFVLCFFLGLHNHYSMYKKLVYSLEICYRTANTVYWLFKHPWRIQYFIMNVLLILLLLWWWILDAFLLRYLRKRIHTETTFIYKHLFILFFHCISSVLFTFMYYFLHFQNTNFRRWEETPSYFTSSTCYYCNERLLRNERLSRKKWNIS